MFEVCPLSLSTHACRLLQKFWTAFVNGFSERSFSSVFQSSAMGDGFYINAISQQLFDPFWWNLVWWYTLTLPTRLAAKYLVERPPSWKSTEAILPKVNWEEHVTTPHSRECTRPLRVLLAVQCPLQTSLDNHSAAGTLHPHRSCHMRSVHYTALSDPPPNVVFGWSGVIQGYRQHG